MQVTRCSLSSPHGKPENTNENNSAQCAPAGRQAARHQRAFLYRTGDAGGRAAGTASAVTEVPSIAAVSAGTANARCTATTDLAGARAGQGR